MCEKYELKKFVGELIVIICDVVIPTVEKRNPGLKIYKLTKTEEGFCMKFAETFPISDEDKMDVDAPPRSDPVA